MHIIKICFVYIKTHFGLISLVDFFLFFFLIYVCVTNFCVFPFLFDFLLLRTLRHSCGLKKVVRLKSCLDLLSKRALIFPLHQRVLPPTTHLRCHHLFIVVVVLVGGSMVKRETEFSFSFDLVCFRATKLASMLASCCLLFKVGFFSVSV